MGKQDNKVLLLIEQVYSLHKTLFQMPCIHFYNMDAILNIVSTMCQVTPLGLKPRTFRTGI